MIFTWLNRTYNALSFCRYANDSFGTQRMISGEKSIRVILRLTSVNNGPMFNSGL